MSLDDKRPWERLPKESNQSFEAFMLYRDMGKKRSLAKVSNELGKSKALMDRWSSRDRWVERVQAYDDHMDRLELEQRDTDIKDMLERHSKVSMLFQQKVIEGLKVLKGETLSPSDLIRIFTDSVKVERLSRGITDVANEVKLNQNQQKLDLDKAKANMNDTTLEESSGFLEGIEKIGADVWEEDKEKLSNKKRVSNG